VVDDASTLSPSHTNEPEGGRLRQPVERARKNGRVVRDLELVEHVEDRVGDRISRRPKPSRTPAGRALDRVGSTADLGEDLVARAGRQAVVVRERVIADLDATARGLPEGFGRLGTIQVGPDREEREGDAMGAREIDEPRHGDVVDRALHGSLGGETVDSEVVRDFVEVDVDGGELHEPES
jgi:hypothetical protein